MTAGRILFVSYCFAPVLSPEGLQATRVAQVLAGTGWDVRVLTVDERTTIGTIDRRQETALEGLVTVRKVWSPEVVTYALRGAALRVLLALGLPESQLLWALPAIRAGRRMVGSAPADVIVSRSAFPTSNVVGLALANASGLPWLAHFSDPWTDGPYVRLNRRRLRLSRWLERRIVERADRLTFTTARAADLVMAKYPGAWRAKAEVIPHGYTPRAPSGPRAPGPLRLAYTGSFYIGYRTPEALLRALHRLDARSSLRGRLELTFVGPVPKQYTDLSSQLGLDGVVEFRAGFDIDAAERASEAADVLVVIDAAHSPSVYLPSKLVDYLAYRKPILGLTPADGESADLLERLGLRSVAPHDLTAIADAVEELLRRHAALSLDVPAGFDEVARDYTIARTGARAAALIADLVSRPRPAAPRK